MYIFFFPSFEIITLALHADACIDQIVCIYIYVCMYIHVCMYVCIYVYTYVYVRSVFNSGTHSVFNSDTQSVCMKPNSHTHSVSNSETHSLAHSDARYASILIHTLFFLSTVIRALFLTETRTLFLSTDTHCVSSYYNGTHSVSNSDTHSVYTIICTLLLY